VPSISDTIPPKRLALGMGDPEVPSVRALPPKRLLANIGSANMSDVLTLQSKYGWTTPGLTLFSALSHSHSMSRCQSPKSGWLCRASTTWACENASYKFSLLPFNMTVLSVARKSLWAAR
jgi:hypothetical protein